jgi:general secretion pathway protein E
VELSRAPEPLEEEPTRAGPAPTRDTRSAALRKEMGRDARALAAARAPRFFEPVGCEHCAQTGYRGRVAIAEILVIDDPVRNEILNQSDAVQIQRVATSRGMRTLREDGARLVLRGVTSLAEVLAATQLGDLEEGARAGGAAPAVQAERR